jgi:hypothetical protein
MLLMSVLMRSQVGGHARRCNRTCQAWPSSQISLGVIDRDALADAVTKRIGREIAAKSWRNSMSTEREGRDAIVIVQTTSKMFLCAAANDQ